jgi:hypothetical protein
MGTERIMKGKKKAGTGQEAQSRIVPKEKVERLSSIGEEENNKKKRGP